MGRTVKDVTAEVMDTLMNYEWFGNIRELENVIERAMILSDSEYINKIDLGRGERKDNLKIDTWLSTLSFGSTIYKLKLALCRI